MQAFIPCCKGRGQDLLLLASSLQSCSLLEYRPHLCGISLQEGESADEGSDQVDEPDAESWQRCWLDTHSLVGSPSMRRREKAKTRAAISWRILTQTSHLAALLAQTRLTQPLRLAELATLAGSPSTRRRGKVRTRAATLWRILTQTSPPAALLAQTRLRADARRPASV